VTREHAADDFVMLNCEQQASRWLSEYARDLVRIGPLTAQEICLGRPPEAADLATV